MSATHSHDPHDQHDHAHGHGSHHPHVIPADFNQAFILAIALNIGFVVIEFGFGLLSNSTALLADAGHNLSDVLALGVAWGAALLAKVQPRGRYTYGLGSSSILAALFNAMLLLLACGAIAWEALHRFWEPRQVAGLTVTLVAAVGIVVNGLSAWLFMRGSKDDLNMRGAYLHMAADAAVSLGVVVVGVLMVATGWAWPDPAISLVIVGVILAGTWALFKEAINLSLSAVPSHIDLGTVEQYLLQLPGVIAVDDLHIWAMSTTETALTAILVIPGEAPSDDALDLIADELGRRFSIHHSTLQVRRRPTPHACNQQR